MNEVTSGTEGHEAPDAVSAVEREAIDRRECLRSMGRWSAAAVAAAAGAVWLGSAGTAQAGAWVNRRVARGGAWVNRPGWVNRAGGWINGRGGGGGGWVNRRVGGGGWINRW